MGVKKDHCTRQCICAVTNTFVLAHGQKSILSKGLHAQLCTRQRGMWKIKYIWAFNNPIPVFKFDFGLVTICCIVSVPEECRNMAHAVRSRRCWERPCSTHQLFQEENYSPFEEIDEKQMRELTSSHTRLSLLMSIKACLFTLYSCYENLILRNRGQTCQALQGTDKSR